MKCDGCTLCCKVLDVPWMESPRGYYCKECEPGVGCKIWENVPEECKKFSCAYRLAKKINIDFRPDKCGVVFELITDKIFLGTIDPHLDGLNETIEYQIRQFLDKGFSCVLKHTWLPKPMLFTAPGKKPHDVWKEFKEAVKYGSTKL